jgi:protein TonB
MNAHVQQASILNGRSMTMMAVIGLHALVISALVLIKVVPPLIEKGPQAFNLLINDPPEVIPPPPQPVVKPAKPPEFVVVVPVINHPPESTIPEDAIVAVVGPPQVVDTGPAQADAVSGTGPDIPAPPARTFTELKYRAVMSPDEFYPPTSVSLQEQGVAVVQVCVGTSGKIDGKPTIQAGSGFKRLDQAAIKWAQEALRFTPATENGTAVRACKGFRVVFNLN